MKHTAPVQKLLAALLLLSCSGGVEGLGSATRSDFQSGLLCGWTFKRTVKIGPVLVPGDCWRIQPAPGMSIMEHGANACDADEGTGTRTWVDGEEVDLFTHTGSSGEMLAHHEEVPCN